MPFLGAPRPLERSGGAVKRLAANHVVWGVPTGFTSPAVVVTAYRPNPDRWDRTFTMRRSKDEQAK